MLKNRYAQVAAGLLAALLMAGCGGSSGSSTPIRLVSMPQGNYVGVYRNTSGADAADAGTVNLSLSGNDVVTIDFSSLSDTGAQYSGTLSAKALSGTLISDSGTPFNVTLSENASTQLVKAQYTESNGTKGVFTVGLADNATTPLPVSYAGTYSSVSGESDTISAVIDGRSLSATATSDSGASFPITGVFDDAGTLFMVYVDSAGAENSISTSYTGSLSASFTCTLAESPTGRNFTLALAPAANPQLRHSSTQIMNKPSK